MNRSDKWFFGLMAAYAVIGAFDLYFKWFDVVYVQIAWILAMIIVGLWLGIFPWQKRRNSK